MATAALAPCAVQSNLESPAASQEPCWFAAYTCANHEKRVAAQFRERGIDHFLPLYEAVRRWSDRQMRLELPLFPSYIFVRLSLRERLRILRVPGVVRLVGFGEHPAALPAAEIETLRNGLRGELKASPHPYLNIGRRVRILRGPLAGMQGILLRRMNSLRLVLSIELIMRSVVVNVEAADVLPIKSRATWQRSQSPEHSRVEPSVR